MKDLRQEIVETLLEPSSYAEKSDTILSIIQREVEKESVAFAEWAHLHEYNHTVKTWRHQRGNTTHTSTQLFHLYKQQKNERPTK